MIHGHIDGMIEAMDQVVEGFAIAPYQGGDHAVWIGGHRGAFDRRNRADLDVAAGLDASRRWSRRKCADFPLSLLRTSLWIRSSSAISRSSMSSAKRQQPTTCGVRIRKV